MSKTDEILEAIRQEVGLASAPPTQNWRDAPEKPTVAGLLAAMREDAAAEAIAFLREAVFHHDVEALAGDVAEAVKDAKAELKAKRQAVKDREKVLAEAAKKLDAVRAGKRAVVLDGGERLTIDTSAEDGDLAELLRNAASKEWKRAKDLADHAKRAVEKQQSLIDRLTALGDRLAAMEAPAVPTWWPPLTGK